MTQSVIEPLMPAHLSIHLVILALFAGLGYIEARRLAARHGDLALETLHHKARYIYPILVLIIIAFAALAIPMMNRTLMWRMPLWFDIYGGPLKFAVLIACFTFLFSLVSTIAVLTAHRERKAVVLASALLIAMFPLFAHQYLSPVYPHLSHIKFNGKDDVIYQSSPSSCAAASGANIAHILGIEKTEKQMARLMNTSRLIGTNAGQIIHAMRQVGITCHKKQVEGSNIENLAAPAMLFIDNADIGPESHAVAFMGREKGALEIWDPLEGRQSFTPSQLKTFWKGKGLECTRSGSPSTLAG